MASSCHGSIGHQSIYLVQQSFCFDFPCYFHHRFAHICCFPRGCPCSLLRIDVLLYGCGGLSGGFGDGPEFVFEVIECLCTVVRRGRRFGRDDPKDIAYDAEVGGVLYFQDECHRAVNDGLYEVCGYGPAVGALDTAQCVLKVGAEAGRYRGSGSMLA